MTGYIDTKVSNLVINNLTQEKYDELLASGQINPDELYCTPDTRASAVLFEAKWFDHIVDDMSWLRADTFSWQSEDVYKAAYEHLAKEYKATPPEYYAWYWSEMGVTVYTTSSAPKVGDDVYIDNDGLFQAYNTIVKVDSKYIYIQYDDSSASRKSQDDVGGTALSTDTIGDITIAYYQAEDGHKICLPDQESNIVALHEKTGAADYYLLDTTNKQFKLPRKQKRTLIQAVKNTNGTWYNLYSDGWLEQGGTASSGSSSVVFPVAFSDTTYYFNANLTSGGSASTGHIISSGYGTTGCTLKEGQYQTPQRALTNNAKWIASGYAAESVYASAGVRLEYYYVGNFEQSAVEQTAGLNAEMFNNKADRNLLNTTDNVDIVVESQLPTAENGYTWYRKYKSGWVEQGGLSTSQTVTLPVEMADTSYGIQLTGSCSSANNNITVHGWRDLTTTGFTTQGNVVNNASQSAGSNTSSKRWYVCGMSAQ